MKTRSRVRTGADFNGPYVCACVYDFASVSQSQKLSIHPPFPA